MFAQHSSCFCFICIVEKTIVYFKPESASIYNDLDQSSKAVGKRRFDLFLVAKDGVNKFIESKYNEDELFEKAKVYLTTPVRKAGYIDKTQVTENMVFAGGTALSGKTMLNPSRVATYAISRKDYDKTLLTDELIDPDKQVKT